MPRSFIHETKTSMLHTNMPRSFIHEPTQARYTQIYLVLSSKNPHKYATHKYASFFIHEPKQACYTQICLVLSSRSPHKYATHKYTQFFHPWAHTSMLHKNMPCSFIHSFIHEPTQAHYTWIYLVLSSMSPHKHATQEYASFFNSFFHPWAHTSTLHTNMSGSYIHVPTQARYTGICLVLSSMSANKHATHKYASFFYPRAHTSMLHKEEVPSEIMKGKINFFNNKV